MPMPKKPTALHILHGNPSKIKDLGKNEPKPAPIAPKCPPFLSKDAKKEWKRVAPQLEKLGLLTQIDMVALAGYCQSYARWKEAEEFLNDFGTTYTLWERNDDGSIKTDVHGKPIMRYIQQFPQVSIANKAMQQIRAFCAEFGMTPSSRGRIQVPGMEDREDEMEQMLNKKR